MAQEKIYTIPVTDAYKEDCNCPICYMYNLLEKNKIEFIFDTAYMEDDIRSETNRLGFCEKHYGMISTESNRLGLALILETHLKSVHMQIMKKVKSIVPIKKGKPGKNNGNSSLNQLITETLNKCYVCETVQVIFDMYIDTIMYLYKKDPAFKPLFENTKGYCMKHFGMLYDTASNKLSGTQKEAFINTLIVVYENNMDQIQADMAWFIRKFDYRFKDEPWHNAKTAIPRALHQISSISIKD
ncbi:MAG: DUF6062 family protein [Vallitaleaceae bacterium]|jgi:hypothetical protein|nr:DUF6062 family protein [Vallitaleaceae bacterium]